MPVIPEATAQTGIAVRFPAGLMRKFNDMEQPCAIE
jgi:hypothetical protein